MKHAKMHVADAHPKDEGQRRRHDEDDEDGVARGLHHSSPFSSPLYRGNAASSRALSQSRAGHAEAVVRPVERPVAEPEAHHDDPGDVDQEGTAEHRGAPHGVDQVVPALPQLPQGEGGHAEEHRLAGQGATEKHSTAARAPGAGPAPDGEAEQANAKNSAVSSVSVSNPIRGTSSAHHVLRRRSMRSSPVTPVANPHDRMVSTTSAQPVRPGLAERGRPGEVAPHRPLLAVGVVAGVLEHLGPAHEGILRDGGERLAVALGEHRVDAGERRLQDREEGLLVAAAGLGLSGDVAHRHQRRPAGCRGGRRRPGVEGARGSQSPVSLGAATG